MPTAIKISRCITRLAIENLCTIIIIICNDTFPRNKVVRAKVEDSVLLSTQRDILYRTDVFQHTRFMYSTNLNNDDYTFCVFVLSLFSVSFL